MSLYDHFVCRKKSCGQNFFRGFHGDFHGVYFDFCKNCFKSIYMKEIQPNEPEYKEGLVVQILLIKNESKEKKLKPSEKKLLIENKTKALIQKNNVELEFKRTNEFLYFNKETHELISGIEQGKCPHCKEKEWQFDFMKKKTCPKCGNGKLERKFYG